MTLQEYNMLFEKSLEDQEKTMSDNVNHPAHYNSGSIECIDAMISAYGEEVVANFCMCNAFKYIWRFNNKNGIEDVNKALWYLNKMKELQNKQKEK